MISCVCPTTASRWWCLPLAIECWQQQTYRGDTELVVVVDGDPYIPADPLDPHGTREHITNLLPNDDRVRYAYLQGKRTLGEKYNACMRLARGDWVALWADDDWHAPTRLEATAALLPGADVIGDWTIVVHALYNDVTRRYVAPMPDPPVYVISGTMAFRRALGLEARFPSQQRGSDDTFVRRLLVERNARLARLVQPPYHYVAMCHGGNITNGRLPEEDPLWQTIEETAEEIMNGDLAKYEAAYLLRA